MDITGVHDTLHPRFPLLSFVSQRSDVPSFLPEGHVFRVPTNGVMSLSLCRSRKDTAALSFRRT